MNSEPYSNTVLTVLMNDSFDEACLSFSKDILANRSFLNYTSVETLRN